VQGIEQTTLQEVTQCKGGKYREMLLNLIGVKAPMKTRIFPSHFPRLKLFHESHNVAGNSSGWYTDAAKYSHAM
jgi:hypothetical protein